MYAIGKLKQPTKPTPAERASSERQRRLPSLAADIIMVVDVRHTCTSNSGRQRQRESSTR